MANWISELRRWARYGTPSTSSALFRVFRAIALGYEEEEEVLKGYEVSAAVIACRSTV
jgi:hypothetical protein